MTVDLKTGVDTKKAERIGGQYRDAVHGWFEERVSLNAVLVALGMELTRLFRQGRAPRGRVEKLEKGLRKLGRSRVQDRPIKQDVDRLVERHRRLVAGWADEGVDPKTVLFTIGTVIYSLVRQCAPQRDADELLLSILEMVNSTETMKAATRPDRVGDAPSVRH
jgi:hypothetical protein